MAVMFRLLCFEGETKWCPFQDDIFKLIFLYGIDLLFFSNLTSVRSKFPYRNLLYHRIILHWEYQTPCTGWRHYLETFSLMLLQCAYQISNTCSSCSTVDRPVINPNCLRLNNLLLFIWLIIIPPATKLGGVYWIHPVCLVCLSVRPSVCLSVRPSVRPSVRSSVRPSVCLSTFRVCPVASTVQDGFFPYLVQMINSMRGCVACDDPWPWPISSRSFSLDLENCVNPVTVSVLDRLFPYLPQIITTIRGCVAC